MAFNYKRNRLVLFLFSCTFVALSNGIALVYVLRFIVCRIYILNQLTITIEM
ncbi:hypothetical protein [Lacrimispora sp.]|uniref:hypothetical protein n=1 Tax=Lacrimispora sp. TaxID=2719234 RepID=UPI00285EF7A2|nr:hypothetical protein [Lacrimispora sp.]MDR7814527.1 hypothetical protein [Lacrimispora sp.]